MDCHVKDDGEVVVEFAMTSHKLEKARANSIGVRFIELEGTGWLSCMGPRLVGTSLGWLARMMDG